MNNLNQILDEVITASFPELMGEDIQIEYKVLKDALLEYGELSSDGFYIEVDNEMKETSKDVLIGGIAPELVHIVVDKNMTKKERRKDKNLGVLIRGYGKQLLEFMEFSELNGFPFYKEDGLSIREIKAIIKNNNQ